MSRDETTNASTPTYTMGYGPDSEKRWSGETLPTVPRTCCHTSNPACACSTSAAAPERFRWSSLRS